jgi:hypothetical protein
MIAQPLMQTNSRYEHGPLAGRSSWAGLAERPFQPNRPQQARAKRVLEEFLRAEQRTIEHNERHALAQEAWEVCAAEGLIPVDWIGGDRRWVDINYAVVKSEPDRTLRYGQLPALELCAWPPSVRACYTMAADPSGILAAEELGRFLLDALCPLSAQPISTVVWRIDGGDPEPWTLLDVYYSPEQPVAYSILALEGERAFAAALGSRAPQGWPLSIARMARNSAHFDIMVQQKITTMSIDGQSVTPLHDSNPLHRAAEIFAMGYGVERAVRHQQLRLIAMPIS